MASGLRGLRTALALSVTMGLAALSLTGMIKTTEPDIARTAPDITEIVPDKKIAEQLPPVTAADIPKEPAKKIQAVQTVIPGLKVMPVPEPPPKLEKAFIAASRDTPYLPYEFLKRLSWAESRHDLTAKAEKTSACGALQIVEDTMKEDIRKHAHKHGYDGLSDLVKERYVKRRDGKIKTIYEVVNQPGAQKKVSKACYDPRLSSHVTVDHLDEYGAVLEQRLQRQLNFTDMRYLQLLGLEGSTPLLDAYHNHPESRNDPVTKYVPKDIVKGNPSAFARTVGESYKKVARQMSLALIPTTAERNNPSSQEFRLAWE